MAKTAKTVAPEKKPRVSRKIKAPLTTRENLSALIGTARKTLRKDKGLNGDVDRRRYLVGIGTAPNLRFRQTGSKRRGVCAI